MRVVSICFTIVLLVSSSPAARAASWKVTKVLPLYLNRDGRHAVSPSLFDRDAYQSFLRHHPEERSGVRFAIHWKTSDAAVLKLRVEMRGALEKEATTATLEESVQHRGFFGHWFALQLAGADYKKFGELVAWRVTLWKGGQQVAEQKSFLW